MVHIRLHLLDHRGSGAAGAAAQPVLPALAALALARRRFVLALGVLFFLHSQVAARCTLAR